MAYMQKYPSAIKLQDLLSSAAKITPETISAQLERMKAADDVFAWPPPSAIGLDLPGPVRK